MTDASQPNAARALAARVLTSVLAGERYAAPALDDALTRRRLSSRDSGLATHIVYGTLRHHFALQAALAPLLRGPTQPKVRALLLAGAFEKLVLGKPSHAVVNEYVNLAKREFGPIARLVNAVLRRVEAPAITPETEFNLPAWLIPHFEDAYGEQAERVMLDFLTPAPVWLWLTPEGVSDIESEGGAVEPGYADVHRVTLPKPLRETRAFQHGHAQPINPASFAAVEALGDVRDRRVLDLAGGAGVKAAMLAARGAHVTSVDVDARKHHAAYDNLRRLHLDAEFIPADLRAPATVNGAEIVLLDAPCTGTGTLRAHPEIKLRLTPEAIAEAGALQRSMLETAASLVQDGGVLVYSVCSVTSTEGPDVVRAFLRDHAEFQPAGLHISVPAVQDEFGLRTLAVNGLDGFYIAKLRKRATAGQHE